MKEQLFNGYEHPVFRVSYVRCESGFCQSDATIDGVQHDPFYNYNDDFNWD